MALKYEILEVHLGWVDVRYTDSETQDWSYDLHLQINVGADGAASPEEVLAVVNTNANLAATVLSRFLAMKAGVSIDALRSILKGTTGDIIYPEPVIAEAPVQSVPDAENMFQVYKVVL